jgi:hypothetical protein
MIRALHHTVFKSAIAQRGEAMRTDVAYGGDIAVQRSKKQYGLPEYDAPHVRAWRQLSHPGSDIPTV